MLFHQDKYIIYDGNTVTSIEIPEVAKIKIERKQPWLVWLSGLSTGLQTERLLVQFPVRTHAWAVGQVPSWGRVRSTSSMFHSFSVSLPFPSLTNKFKSLLKKEMFKAVESL